MTWKTERLSELAKEATEYCQSQPKHIISSLWEVKFAELIVRECIQICEQIHETPNGKMRCANDDASVRIIKERFGI